MKKLTIFLIFCVISFSVLAEGLEPIPALSGRVTDITATLSPEEIIFIEQILVGLDSSTTCELVVLIIPTTGSETIEEYSMRVAEEWKIGKKEQDNGVILLIAKEDREVRIEVGYGLEAILTDGSSKRIIDNYIVPDFKNGDFYGGIYSGVGQISGILKGEIDYVLDYLKEINVEYEVEIEHKSLMSKYPNIGFLLMMIGFLIPILPIFFMNKSKAVVIITSIIPIIFVILVGFYWESSVIVITLIFFPIIVSLFTIITKLTHKGKGKINFFTGGSSTYNSSNSSSYSSSSYSSSSSSYSSGSSYSGGGGSFGGGGASGGW